MELPKRLAFVIAELTNAGYRTYLVGGCLRDALMGRESHDWDLATTALPSQVKDLFAGYRLIETGVYLGAVGIIDDGAQIQVTTMRRESRYPDGRHPAQVDFVKDIEIDLSRRDFTMNALAYAPGQGLIDPYEGAQDILDRRIRCVGDPRHRLTEDALRVMRALRFSSQLGFTIEEGLSDCLHALGPLLTSVSAERKSQELLGILTGQKVEKVLIEYPDVLSWIIPEIMPTVGFDQRSRYHSFNVWEHTAKAVAASSSDPLVRLALLMHDLGKPATYFLDKDGCGHFPGYAIQGAKTAQERLSALRFSKATVSTISQAIRFHQAHFEPGSMQMWLAQLGEPLVRLILEVKCGDLAAHTEEVAKRGAEKMSHCKKRVDELLEQGACISLGNLALNGRDLQMLGMQEGKKIGNALDYLLNQVVTGELANERLALMDAAQAFIAK